MRINQIFDKRNGLKTEPNNNPNTGTIAIPDIDWADFISLLLDEIINPNSTLMIEKIVQSRHTTNQNDGSPIISKLYPFMM